MDRRKFLGSTLLAGAITPGKVVPYDRPQPLAISPTSVHPFTIIAYGLIEPNGCSFGTEYVLVKEQVTDFSRVTMFGHDYTNIHTHSASYYLLESLESVLNRFFNTNEKIS